MKSQNIERRSLQKIVTYYLNIPMSEECEVTNESDLESISNQLSKFLEMQKIADSRIDSYEAVIIDQKANAISMGLYNIKVNTLSFSEALIAGIITVSGAIQNPLMLGFAFLLLVRSIQKAMTISLSRKHAAVILTFIDKTDGSGGHTMLYRANRILEYYGEESITKNDLDSCLEDLERLGITSRSEDTWGLEEEIWLVAGIPNEFF